MRDARGDAISAERAVVDQLDDAIDAYLGARADARARVGAVIALDAGCVMAHCLDGYLSMLASTRDMIANARAAWTRGAAAADRSGASHRERLHLGALQLWSAGDLQGAAAAWEHLLAEYPRDVVAIKVSQFVFSYLGDSERMRDAVERVLPAWSAEVHGYGFVLGCHAYALEETGDYARAEDYGRHAIELNRADIWAAHAVAHVSEMRGRPREGIRWIASLGTAWQGCSNFALHLRWHESLYHLELEEYDRALDLYDREVRAQQSREYLDVANAVSLLWRLEQAGVHVGARWSELSLLAAERRDDHALVFVDMHYVMALVASGDVPAVNAFMESCERFASTNVTEGRVMSHVGLPLARAVIAHRRGDYADAVAHLLPVRERVREIGGSHAQRDVFEQLLIDAAWRSHNIDVADALLARRMVDRPGNLWALRHRAIMLEERASSGTAAAWREVEQQRELQARDDAA